MSDQPATGELPSPYDRLYFVNGRWMKLGDMHRADLRWMVDQFRAGRDVLGSGTPIYGPPTDEP